MYGVHNHRVIQHEGEKMVGIYFSGTGNTRYCVRRFLEKCNQNACDYAIESEKAMEAVKAMDDSDILVFGYSVQYSNLPKMVKDYVIEHAALWENKKIFIVATMGLFSGDGAGVLGRLLTRYGAEIVGGLHLRMPDSICDEKVLKYTKEKNQKIIEQSEAKIDSSVKKFKEGHPTQEGLGFFYHMAGLFGQRLYFYNKTGNYSEKLRIDVNRCIGCGLCASQCPMQNIIMKESGGEKKIAVGLGKCTMCYRCVNQCPEKAITLLGKKVIQQRKL